MDHFLIVTNDGKDIDHSVTAKVRRLLEEKGKTDYWKKKGKLALFAIRMKRK